MRAQLKRWIFLSGHRYGVTSGLLLILVGVVLIPNITRFTIRNLTPLSYMASALIAGNVTLITLVVAINQVILSQELESPGSLRDEIERTAEYRQAALDQQTAPNKPSDFLQQLLQQTHQHAQALEGLIPESTDEVNDQFLTDLRNHCKQAIDQLKRTSEKLSNVVIPTLEVDYTDDIHNCHQLQARYDEDSHEQLHTALDQLTSDLENLDVARQYFTTMFMKEELATLSRLLLYIGIFAISMPIALLFQLTTYAGSSPSMPELFTLTALTALFGLVPLALLIAFVLRIATVAQHIAAITPFKA